MKTWVKFSFSLVALLPALTVSTWAEGGLEYFKNLQEVRREIFAKTAPGVLRVELVHRSMPAYLLNNLNRCTSECEFKPWQRGEISDEEASMWQNWCQSFMDFSDTRFRATLQSETDTVVWHDSLRNVFADWLVKTRLNADESSRPTLDRFSARLNEHVTVLADDLERKSAISPKPMVRDQGTGVLIRKGVLVTTHTLARGITNQDWIRVWSDEQVAYSTGELVGGDPDTNLAVFRLSGPAAELEPIGSGDDEIKPQVGDFVFFFCHPFNQGLSMQTGEITSLYNRLPFFNCASFHSTSFPTSPGTLGGPIVDLEGRLVGINTLYMGQGNMSEITYTLPVDSLNACVDQILDKGHVERGRLGVFLNDFHCKIGHHTRVSVLKVLPNSAAEEGGIHEGDVINAINGKNVNCRMEVVSLLYQSPPSQPINFEIDRAGELHEIQLKLAAPVKNPDFPPQVSSNSAHDVDTNR